MCEQYTLHRRICFTSFCILLGYLLLWFKSFARYNIINILPTTIVKEKIPGRPINEMK